MKIFRSALTIASILSFFLLTSAASYGQLQFHPGPEVGCPLCVMAKEMRTVMQPTVVYSLVRYREKPGEVERVRLLQSTYAPNQAVKEAYVDDGGLSYQDFQTQVAAAGLGGDRFRDALAKKMRSNTDFLPPGALALFRDHTGLNVNPTVLGLNDIAIIANGARESAERLAALAKPYDSTPTFKAFLGWPSGTAEDIKDIYGPEERITEKKRSEWKGYTESFLDNAKQHKVSVVDLVTIRKGDKESFLHSLEEAENIIFVTFHGTNATIRLPGKEPFSVTPDDIEKLHLAKEPFVVVRVCESDPGDNARFAQAFLAAGAKGVSVNVGKVSPERAMSDVFRFIKMLGESQSVLDALKKMETNEKGDEDIEYRLRSKLFTANPIDRELTA